MSLKDPEDEYDDVISEKKSRFRGKGKKSKGLLLILLVGVILGAALMHYGIEPIIAEAQFSLCKDCLSSKELRDQENDCLYSLVPDAQTAINSCTPKAPAPSDDNLDTNQPVDVLPEPAPDSNQ